MARVDAYLAAEMPHEQFTEEQIAHWASIRARSTRFNDKVCSLLCPLPGARA